MKLRIAVLQMSSRLNQFRSNVAKAHDLVSQIPPNPLGTPQLIVFSELALTIYNFHSRSSLLPYCEIVGKGENFRMAQQLSIKNKSFTLLGYPEITEDSKIYNSAMLVSPLGKLVYNYRKTHLYESDENFGCSESEVGFQSFPIDFQDSAHKSAKEIIKCSIGICMDLNPYKFEAPFEKFEFATHCKENDVSLVLCPMAWLHSESPSITKQPGDWDIEMQEVPQVVDTNGDIRGGSESSRSSIEYWWLRLSPLLALKDKLITIVICNRSGLEDDVLYCGTSCILQLDTSKRKIHLLGSLGWKDEGLLFREVDTMLEL
ncbi:unnamed protein product [Kuraishia capsulata CBS 1993]|uniref:CN hydrolase domain-containing protein n=1 Tax=Kuraishia capsulata CBS 1993 TaxID=1382522 RepID=W6MY52_9ASCO|nr:uncharacterized protein KUCA_T00006025001 [Kuraishia capsulata CBS 1993]CDK30030.1 unnamed protein product [Kuraishia capsulata CBS 1993]